MNPTPGQIRQAIANLQQPDRTCGARIRDALTYLEQSRNNKTAEAVSLSPVAGHHNKWAGNCYGQ